MAELSFVLRTAICRGAQEAVTPPPITPPVETPGTLTAVKIIFYDPFDGAKYMELGSDIQGNKLGKVDYVIGPNGCGKFSFELGELPQFFVRPRSLVNVYMFGDTQIPRYAGFVGQLPPVHQNAANYKYSGFGFYEQLDWVIVDGTWAGDEVSAIIDNILRTTVEPFTDIVYNAGKIEGTDFVVSEIKFDHVSAKDALEDLATLAGNYELGVDTEREFYFRPRDISVNPDVIKFGTKHFSKMTVKMKTSHIKNKLYIKSGELKTAGVEEGTNYVGEVEDLTSIGIWGLREKVITSPSILDDTDAFRWGSYELSKVIDPVFSATVDRIELGTDLVEARGKARIWITIPVPTGWTDEYLATVATRVLAWDWDAISVTETFSGRMFYDWDSPGLITFCFELFVKEIQYKIMNGYSVTMTLGAIEDFVADEYVEIVEFIKQEELLAQQNTEQLYALP